MALSPKVLLGVMLFLCSKEQVTAQAHKTYIIDLDAPPVERWVEVGRDNPQMGPVIKNLTQCLIPNDTMPFFEEYARRMDQYMPEEYLQEIQGLADASGVSLEDLVINNLMYDMVVLCTSIVCQDTEGYIWHARNFDYECTEDFRSLTIFVEFHRNGQMVYRAVTFAGYIGVLTGEKINAYTVSFDQRDPDKLARINSRFALSNKDAVSLFVASRQVFDSADSYADAVELLASITLTTPCYIIIGGAHPGEGVVITRQRTYAVDMWFLDPFNGRWFIVETNYDHWLEPPTADDRRNPAIRKMNEMGQQNISAANLLDILMSPEVTMGITVTSTVFSASQPDVYATYVFK